MRPLGMTSAANDVHVAFVSYISHVNSMLLALTVLDKEKDEKNIFNLASGGFDSTVTLAKGSADMWTPSFMQNRKNLLPVMGTYIEKLNEFTTAMKNQDEHSTNELIIHANSIRKVLK